jgi:hypothetical protein
MKKTKTKKETASSEIDELCFNILLQLMIHFEIQINKDESELYIENEIYIKSPFSKTLILDEKERILFESLVNFIKNAENGKLLKDLIKKGTQND